MATLPQQPEGESFRIVFGKETDGRWLAEVPELPGVMVFGATKKDAEVAVTSLALRVLAHRTEQARNRRRPSAFCEPVAQLQSKPSLPGPLAYWLEAQREEGLVPHPASTPWFPGA
jgi:predicted RNase H-like HicB family nuclease